MQDEIERFFQSYRDAYNRLDPDGITDHVAVPSILIARDCVLWTTREQVRANMKSLLELYRRNEFERADFALAHLTPQGRNDAAVDVLWTIRRGAQPPSRFHTGYNLHRASDGWRILLCTAYEEQHARTGTN